MDGLMDLAQTGWLSLWWSLTCEPFPHQTLQMLPPGSRTGHPRGKLVPPSCYSQAPRIHRQQFVLPASLSLQTHCSPEERVYIKVNEAKAKCPAVAWINLRFCCATWSRALSLWSLSSRLLTGRSLAACNSSFQSVAYKEYVCHLILLTATH